MQQPWEIHGLVGTKQPASSTWDPKRMLGIWGKGVLVDNACRMLVHIKSIHAMIQNLDYISVSCSVMSNSATPRTGACQAVLSMKFSRQEYWSGLPFPPPRNI